MEAELWNYKSILCAKRNFKSQNILGVEYVWFLMQWFEFWKDMGAQGRSPWVKAILVVLLFTGGGTYWDFFFFSLLLSSSNKQIQRIYVLRLIILLLYEISIKEKKNDLMIISKPHAYLQTMTKSPVKTEEDWYKTAGGVAHTRYLLYIHFNSIEDWKMTKFKMRKKWYSLIWGLYPNHMHIFRPWQKYLLSFKKIGIKLLEKLRIQGIQYTYTWYCSRLKND